MKNYSLTKISIGFFFFALFVPRSDAADKAYDYVIKNVLVLDGESLVPEEQDLAVSGNRIALLGEIPRSEAENVVEADGLVASPGFIDIHTHSDFNPFVYPGLGNKVLQGVTTEVVGNCGMSAAPNTGNHKGEMPAIWKREGVDLPAKISWDSFKDYTEDTEFQGMDTNFAGLVGHGNIHSAIIGMRIAPPSPGELESMKTLLRRSLDEGAFGVSFGLAYLPGVYADHQELVELCRVAGERKKLCAFHIRSESKELLEALTEAVDIAKEAGAPLHISHLKASGTKNWEKIGAAFQKIEDARASGMQITSDAYPYEAGYAELAVMLPDAAYKASDRIDRLRNPEKRPQSLRQLRHHYKKHPVSWDSIRIAAVGSDKNQSLVGKSIAEIARQTGKPGYLAFVDLLAEEEFKVSAFYFSQSEEVIQKVLSKPYVAVGSDSVADGIQNPHPRAYGTFPRMLARCAKKGPVRQNSCWGETIRQMTSLPASFLGLKDRGRLKVGAFADIVLWNPETVKDQADYENPKTFPAGIEWVFVNGQPAVREGAYEPVRTGIFLKKEK